MARPRHARRQRFQHAAGISVRQVGEELFIAAPGEGTIHHLDRMAAGIWRLLAEAKGAEEVIAVVEAAFPDVPKRRIAKDVNDLLAFLEESELIVRVDG